MSGFGVVLCGLLLADNGWLCWLSC